MTIFDPAVPREMVLDRVGQGAPYWGALERDAALAEALAVWQALTGQWVISHQLPLAAGADQYVDVPKQVAVVRRVLWNGTPLAEASQFDFDYGFPGWYGSAGVPALWAPVGINMIALNRTPSASGVLTFEGFREAGSATSPLVADLGAEYLDRLVGYARHYLTFKEGPTENESSSGDLVSFLEAAGGLNQTLRVMDMYKRWMGNDPEQVQRPQGVGPAGPGARS